MYSNFYLVVTERGIPQKAGYKKLQSPRTKKLQARSNRVAERYKTKWRGIIRYERVNGVYVTRCGGECGVVSVVGMHIWTNESRSERAMGGWANDNSMYNGE